MYREERLVRVREVNFVFVNFSVFFYNQVWCYFFCEFFFGLLVILFFVFVFIYFGIYFYVDFIKGCQFEFDFLNRF